MNFAPYQDDAPESTRTPSPRPTTTTSNQSRTASKPSPSTSSTPFYTDNTTDDIEDDADFLPDPSSFEDAGGRGRRFLGFGNRRAANVDTEVDLFATSLPIRLDIQALLCYVALPPVAGAVLLVLEHRSDYVRYVFFLTLDTLRAREEVYGEQIECTKKRRVLTRCDDRFHAWQSSLLFTFLFLIHLIFSFSKFISYSLLIVDLLLITFLAFHAYRDAQTLGRWEVPWIGRLASSFVDEE